MRFFEFKNEEAAGVGIVTKQNATADVPVGGEYMNVKKLFPKKKKKKESIEEAFVNPNFDYEWEEATRYPEFQKIGKDAWIKLAKKGKAVTITSAKGISNTDATEPDSFSSLDKNKQARALAQLDSDKIEMPIVAVYSDGHKELVGGNTRLTALMAKKIPATVWQFEVPDEVANLAINKKESIAYEDIFQGLNPKSEIYVDMDGVLADFFGEWKKLVGKDWRELGKDEIEPALKKIRDDDKFWLNIPLTSNAKNLLDIIKQVKGNYKILSSPLANDPNSEPHKREWIEKNLDFFPPTEVIITKDKAKYATNPDGTPNILIDDYGVNISAWESAGGIGFKHKDHKFERTAKKLKAEIEESFQHLVREYIAEGWSAKYKRSINCSNPKGFSQKAHCAGRKKNEDIEENFADGKKKGKSRPGRVKRAGASCNGSVTSLRKKAKNASGEKAKMYHWCANMKSGRKKG